MKKTVLRSYAKLIAACGVNIQKGQEVFIQAELDQPEFVTMLVEECYKLKAKKVVVDWSHLARRIRHIIRFIKFLLENRLVFRSLFL